MNKQNIFLIIRKGDKVLVSDIPLINRHKVLFPILYLETDESKDALTEHILKTFGIRSNTLIKLTPRTECNKEYYTWYCCNYDENQNGIRTTDLITHSYKWSFVRPIEALLSLLCDDKLSRLHNKSLKKFKSLTNVNPDPSVYKGELW